MTQPTSGPTVTVNFHPTPKGTPPKFLVNGKSFTVTHLQFRQNNQDAWQTLNIENLDQSDLDELAKSCAHLFDGIKPTQGPLAEVTFQFTKAHPKPNGRLDDLLGRTPKTQPLMLKGISTRAAGADIAVDHAFNLEDYNEAAQQTLFAHLQAADRPAQNIVARLPAPQLKSIKKPEPLHVDEESDIDEFFSVESSSESVDLT